MDEAVKIGLQYNDVTIYPIAYGGSLDCRAGCERDMKKIVPITFLAGT